MKESKQHQGNQGREDWYGNKELFEMICQVKDSLGGFKGELEMTRGELRITTEAMKKYNNLRNDLGEAFRRLDALENKALGRASVGQGIREWGGWLVALIALGWKMYAG